MDLDESVQESDPCSSSEVGGDDVSLSTFSCSGCNFFSKDPCIHILCISIITNYSKCCNGTKQWANGRALIISVTRRGGKNDTNVEFATNYSDSAHIWAYAIRKASFCTICTGDNAAVVAAGCSICNHIKTSGATFNIRQLYLIF